MGIGTNALVFLDTASTLDKITNILVYIFIALLIAFAIAMGVIYVRRKGMVTKSSDGGYRGGYKSVRSVSQLVPIDGFFSGMIVQDNGMRFTAGIRCYGFDYFSLDDAVKRNCINKYRGLIRSVNTSVSLYSTYHSFDISKQITKHEQALERIKKELAEVKAELVKYDSLVSAMPMSEALQREQEIKAYRDNYLWNIDGLEKQVEHMQSMIAYLNSFTDVQEEQFQDYSYMVSYEVPFDMVSEPFDVRADNAKRELDNIIHNLRARLNESGVLTRRLSDDDLAIAVYRHSHPSGRNTSDDEILSLLGERRTVGHDGIIRTEV